MGNREPIQARNGEVVTDHDGRAIYLRIYPDCDLSETGLIEAASRMQARRVYTLHVAAGGSEFLWAQRILKNLMMTVKDNPFSPSVNLEPDARLGRTEWYLDNGFDAWGSKGVS